METVISVICFIIILHFMVKFVFSIFDSAKSLKSIDANLSRIARIIEGEQIRKNMREKKSFKHRE